MSTFDGWETQLYGDVMALPGRLSNDELMHFRTKGSKNGVRRYQTESGEWTPLGLKERKAREGWGDSKAERKAAKQVARSERKAARAERRAAKASAKAARVAAMKEARRKSDISKLTDEELKQKLARVKMEQEYKELTKSPALKAGERIIKGVLDYKARKTEAEASKAKTILDMNRVKADIIRAKESTARAKAEAKKAKEERKQTEADVQGGLKIARKAELKKAKTEYRGTTLRGGIARALNTRMNAGLKEKLTSKRKAEGEAKANRILSDSARNLKLRKASQEKADNKPYKDRMNAFEKKQQQRQKKNRKAYEKERRRLAKTYGWNQL